MRKILAIAITLTGFVMGSAYADEPQQQAQEDTTNKQICRTFGETGSRLKTKKICMTAAQWAEQRRQDRMAIEKGQLNGCTPGASC